MTAEEEGLLVWGMIALLIIMTLIHMIFGKDDEDKS